LLNLSEKIKILDGKPIADYHRLCGIYTERGINYRIRKISGAGTKYCQIDIGIPLEMLVGGHEVRANDRTAAASYILRDFIVAAHIANEELNQSETKIDKGFFMVYKFGHKVVPNSLAVIQNEKITLSLDVKMPSSTRMNMAGGYKKGKPSASARGIISSKAVSILLHKNLLNLVEGFVERFDVERFNEEIDLYRDQQFIRSFLRKNGYVCFLGNGAILPRNGKTDYQSAKKSIPFVSPESLAVTISLPSGKSVRGMAIPRGVTVLIGDAYHGKSTILNAIQNGVYNHIKGDGREYVITDDTAQYITAEDGRSVKNTNISFFLSNLPVDTLNPYVFSTEGASSSTSQAAAVAEAVEVGCKLMLFDEDRSANNFLYKDAKIKSIIKNASTRPYLDNAPHFFAQFGISHIFVVGASGEYLKIADTALLVDKFQVTAFTDYEKECDRAGIEAYALPKTAERVVKFSALRSACLRRNVSIVNNDSVKIGGEVIRVTETIPNATYGQVAFVGLVLYRLAMWEEHNTLVKAMDMLYSKIHQDINILQQSMLLGFDKIEYVRKFDMYKLIWRARLTNVQRS